MKQATKDNILVILEKVFISGETYMFVAWLMFLLGLIIGRIIF